MILFRKNILFKKTESLLNSKSIEKLISLGKKQEFLTYEQINNVFPNITNNNKFAGLKLLLESMAITLFELKPTKEQVEFFMPQYNADPQESLLQELDNYSGRTI